MQELKSCQCTANAPDPRQKTTAKKKGQGCSPHPSKNSDAGAPNQRQFSPVSPGMTTSAPRNGPRCSPARFACSHPSRRQRHGWSPPHAGAPTPPSLLHAGGSHPPSPPMGNTPHGCASRLRISSQRRFVRFGEWLNASSAVYSLHRIGGPFHAAAHTSPAGRAVQDPRAFR